VVELLHDGNLFLDQLEGIVLFRDIVPVQGRIEANAGGEGAPAVVWTAEEVRLGAFPQTGLGELLDCLSSALALPMLHPP